MIGKNNPFNVRFVRSNQWVGLTGKNRGFCCFGSVEFGIRAFGVLVFRSYCRFRNKTSVSDVLTTYAPPSENNTPDYIRFVCKHSGLQPDDDIRLRPIEFAYWVSCYEGNPVDRDKIKFVFQKYGIV